MGEAKMRRGTVWSDKEVKALIAIWGNNVQEELDGAVCNKAIFQRVANQLQEEGYNRHWLQCRAKIKNLKTKYREVKDHNGETGRGRKTCKLYRELDRILGHRPASVPSALLDTGESSGASTIVPESVVPESVVPESQESKEEKVDGKANTHHMMEYTFICLLTDGTQTQAHSPLDSTLVHQEKEASDDGKPGDDRSFHHTHTHMHTHTHAHTHMHTHTCTHAHTHAGTHTAGPTKKHKVEKKSKAEKGYGEDTGCIHEIPS